MIHSHIVEMLLKLLSLLGRKSYFEWLHQTTVNMLTLHILQQIRGTEVHYVFSIDYNA